jgi:hypothetical protein
MFQMMDINYLLKLLTERSTLLLDVLFGLGEDSGRVNRIKNVLDLSENYAYYLYYVDFGND